MDPMLYLQHSRVMILYLFSLFMLSAGKGNLQLSEASNVSDSFWAAAQFIALNFDFTTRSLKSGISEFELQRRSENFKADDILLNFDYRKSRVGNVEIIEGWDNHENASGQLYVGMRIRGQGDEKSRATLKFEWRTSNKYKHRGEFGEYLLLEKGDIPYLENSHLPLIHVGLNIDTGRGQRRQELERKENTPEEFIILSNDYLRFSSDEKFKFKSPVPMVPYQLEFAILETNKTSILPCSFSHNHQTFKDGVQVYKLSPHTFDVIRLLKNAGQVNDSFILQPLCDAVDKIIDYCIRRFNRDVTTPELKIVVTDDIPGHWTFSPGLVRIKASLKLEPMFEAVIHAVARHWTVKMTNYETAADIWFEEALTTYIKIDCLQRWKHVIDRGTLFLLSKEPSLVTNRAFLEEVEKRGPRVVQEQPELLVHGARTFANLDMYMMDHLVECIAVARIPYIKTDPLLLAPASTYFKKLSNCDRIGQNNLDVKNFVMFWYSEDVVPVLILHTEPVSEKPSTLLTASHDFLCKRNYPGSACTKVKRDYPFRLAFNFYNVDGTVRQHRVFYENPKEGENRYFLNFSPNENDTLFVVSVQNKPNFLVAYPDHVYENFFRYIRTAYSKLNSEGVCGKECQQTSIWKNGPVFFLLDLFELSRRNVVSLKWTRELVKHFKHFKALRLYLFPEMKRLEYFELLCLGYLLPRHLAKINYTTNRRIFLNFFCKHANYPKPEYADKDREGCQYPLDENKVEALKDQQPPDWRDDCEFWIENF